MQFCTKRHREKTRAWYKPTSGIGRKRGNNSQVSGPAEQTEGTKLTATIIKKSVQNKRKWFFAQRVSKLWKSPVEWVSGCWKHCLQQVPRKINVREINQGLLSTMTPGFGWRIFQGEDGASNVELPHCWKLENSYGREDLTAKFTPPSFHSLEMDYEAPCPGCSWCDPSDL